MNIEILDIKDPSWSKVLNKIPHDVYHLPEYVSLDAERTQTTPEAFLLEDGDKIFFVPYLLRSCADIYSAEQTEIYDVISPYGYPGILVGQTSDDTPGFADFALKQFYQTLKQRNVCSVFMRLHPILGEDFSNIFKSNPFRENGKTVSIDLTLDEGQLWAKTRKGHQSTINKCLRLGLTARVVSFAEYMDEFITIYEETMDRVAASDVYYFSRNYFEGLSKLDNKIHLGIVELDNQIICSCLFFESCGIVQAHLGGTKTEFLKQSPFNLLLHHVRLWAKDRGNKYLHIGGGIGGQKDNLYTFKSGFSKQRHNFFTLRTVIDSKKYNDLLGFRAKTINKSVEDLKTSTFFPAYRAV